MAEKNDNSRLEAFSDGVFAIAMTLLIIDIKIPSEDRIQTSNDLWMALLHIAPSIATFILSFTIILITWVNHHAGFKLIKGSSGSFIYANGFLLLTIVILPFPTGLLGESILTGHAAPAVILYNLVMALQAVAWITMFRAALRNGLAKSESAKQAILQNRKFGYYAIVVYTTLAIIAFWFPLAIAIATTLIWGFWLTIGIRMKNE
jgi:uncharacterized membrane protein